MSRRDFEFTLRLSEWGFYTLLPSGSGVYDSGLFTGHIHTLRYCLYRRYFCFSKIEKISLVVAEKGEKDRSLLVVCLFVSLLDSQVAFDTISCIAKDKYMNRSILNSILIKFFLFFMPLIKQGYLNLQQEKRQLN